MTRNISDVDEEVQWELEYHQAQAKTWLINGLGSKELWEKLSNLYLAELHDVLQLHLGDADFLLLFDFALAVTAKRQALLQIVADADLKS